MNAPYNAARLLLEAADAAPDKPALLCSDGNVSYAMLRSQAGRTAALLAARGVTPGDRVLLALPDTPAFYAAFLGAMLAGACPVAVNTALAADDYAFFRADCRPVITLSTPGHASLDRCDGPALACDDLGPQGLTDCPDTLPACPVSPDDLGFMLYSSGSTGRPKGVPHRHADLLLPADTWGALLHMTADDVVLSSSKLFFAYGLLANMLLPLAAGASVALFKDKPGPYDVFDLIAAHKPTIFFGVPTLYNLLIRAYEPDMDLSCLRLCFSAGEALPPLLYTEWTRLAQTELLDGIGSTEACNVFISNRPGFSRPGTSGRLVAGYEARLVDDTGQNVPDGQRGHLLIRGESMARHYWNNPAKTRDTMLADGFVRTGDVYVATDGWYVHQGRSDDMLKVGGQWVSPVQVEENLLTHAEVAECAVVASRMDSLDRVLAYVVPQNADAAGQALAKALRAHMLALLPDYMCPSRFTFVTDLPKTTTGKVQRFRLRQQERS